MIQVRAVDADGHTSIEVTGHGATTACAAVSAVMHAAILGLEAIALTYPLDLQVDVTSESE